MRRKASAPGVLTWILLLCGCESAGLLMGGVGSGLTGQPNQAQQVIERRRDREAEAARLNAQRCMFLLDSNSREMQMLIDQARMDMQTQQSILAFELAGAPTNEQKAEAYGRYSKRLQDSLDRFLKRNAELEARGRNIEQQCQ